jgi:hypothetical protein
MDKIARILDANLNRGREGLRVVEDIVRFIMDDAKLASQIKNARHEVTALVQQLQIDDMELLQARDSQRDVGVDINCDSEDIRRDVLHIATANFVRAQESMRVLEEFSKLYDSSVASKFKGLRFQLYELEKEILPKLIQGEN